MPWLGSDSLWQLRCAFPTKWAWYPHLAIARFPCDALADVCHFVEPGFDFSELGADAFERACGLLSRAGATDKVVHPQAKKLVTLWGESLG